MIPIGRIIRRIERFIMYRILHADDTPHRLALGIALGIFIAWTPTIGFQMILVLLLAPLFRANGRVALPMVWISNPLTLFVIYGPNYWLGNHLLRLFTDRPEITFQRLKELLNIYNLSHLIENAGEMEFWSNLWNLFMKFLNVSLDLWVGSIIVGLIIGCITYVTSYKFIVWYRKNNPIGRLHLRKMRRKKKEQDICRKTQTDRKISTR